ncbi:MAG: hypothetical protein A2095_06195 [Sphingomonadales bacterium GWF1_63_6]|nr:MAG: hypothetical protein A2095_06195 [Sphingomonadales bacterium GWF1_63_6]
MTLVRARHRRKNMFEQGTGENIHRDRLASGQVILAGFKPLPRALIQSSALRRDVRKNICVCSKGRTGLTRKRCLMTSIYTKGSRSAVIIIRFQRLFGIQPRICQPLART